MVSETKAIETINKYLTCAQESNIHQYLPVVASQIRNDSQLCECLIDFLGNIYVYAGLDENYEENACGSEIQEAINFLSFCNGQV